MVAAVSRVSGHRVPVIALTGYLGAGKTTVLNHLLLQPGARLGVVVNDFGELNVDAALVAGQVDAAAEISGGCLCCLPDSGGLDDALDRLSQPSLGLDAIVVEASGAADPLILARLIRYSGAQHVRFGGLVEVIDAVEHFRTVDLWPRPPARYGVATLVVINKVELLPDDRRREAIAGITARVRELNPHAPVLVAAGGRVDPLLVFDTADDEDPQDQLPIGSSLREQAHAHDHHEHASVASALLPDPVSPSGLVELLQEPPAGAYRIKGRVRVKAPRRDRGYLVNVVGPTIHVAPLAEPPVPGELVAIGMGLDVASAQRRLAAVRDAPADRPDAEGLRRLHRYRRLSE